MNTYLNSEEQRDTYERASGEPIPVRTAAWIARTYGYDQVIIIARKVGEGGKEHVTTYGRGKEHCDVAARAGEHLKKNALGWTDETIHEDHRGEKL